MASQRRSSPGYRVQILAFPGATPIVPVGLFDLLRKSNGIAQSLGRAPAFEVEIVAAAARPGITAAGGLPLRCHLPITDALPADLVIASPMDPEVLDRGSREPRTLDFLRRAHRRGSTIASVCTGAFALGEAGLLDGRSATTHWAFQGLFQERFPRVRLEPQAILVQAERVVTAGGATSFLNLALHLVEQRYGVQVSRQAARMFLIDVHKPPQGSYAQLVQTRPHQDEQIARAQAWIEGQGAGTLTVNDLTRHVAMTRRTLIRRFKAATGLTPIEYLQRARIEQAKNLLEGSGHSIAQIAGQAGYQEPAAFRRLFVRHVGLTPAEYRKRHGN